MDIFNLDAAKNAIAPNLSDYNGSNDTTVEGTGDVSIFYDPSSTTAKNINGAYSLDSFFFNWPSLDVLDSFKVYPYTFVVHDNGKPVLVLTMPLAPQNINISVPVAATTTATMASISEEQGGAPLRPITVSGTSGMKPVSDVSENSATNQSPSSGLLNYMFANTISAVGNVVSDVNKLVNAFSSNTSVNSPVAANSVAELNTMTTGYRVIHSMMRFFDWYIDAKKGGGDGNRLSLCFCMHKDKMFYDVTLNGYNVRKAAGTMEYEYNIQMTAWRRRLRAPTGAEGSIVTTTSTTKASANYFARASLALQLATKTISDAVNILSGIRSDFSQNILDPVKQLGLLIGTARGAGTTIASFPNSIAALSRDAVTQFLSNSGLGNTRLMDNLKNEMAAAGIAPGAIDIAISVDPLLGGTGWDGSGIPNSGGQSSTGTSKGQASTGNSNSNPFNQIFSNPSQYQSILALFPINALPLSQKVKTLINNQIATARAVKFSGVQKIRDNVENFAAAVSSYFGGGDATYNRLQGLPPPNTLRQLTTDDIALLSALNDIVMVADTIANSLQNQTPNPTNDYAQFFQNYAGTQGITFEQNSSKFYIPFPYNATLEQLAYQYLGNPDRWMEIVAANALQAPYIDEDGFQVPFINSGSNNNIIIAIPDNLYIGQVVVLNSKTQSPSKRHIMAIDVVSPVETVVFLDGAADLANFTVEDGAYLQAFLPDTVNSNMMIAIPSKVPVNIPGGLQVNPDINDLSVINSIAKSDFLLATTSSQGYFDLVFSPFDVQVSSGSGNLVQAGLIKLLTRRGELLNDPTFGNPVQAGTSVAEINVSKVLDSLRQTFSSDPRFTGLIAGKAVMANGAVAISVMAGVSGSKAYLPLTATIPQ